MFVQDVGIFLVGGNEVFFAIWPISSYVGVQIVRVLVRLMNLIVLNEFWTNVTSPMSLKIFSRTTFRSVVKKTLIFGVLKVFTSNFTYYNLYYRKLKLIPRKKYALYFPIQPLHFLQTLVKIHWILWWILTSFKRKM